MSTFTARTFTQAFADARAIGLLNDPNAERYPDDVLLPHGAFVHGEIQEELAAHGIPLLETTTTSLTYAANATTIVVPAGITDLSVPLEIWEKNQSDSVWVPMKQVTNLRPPLVSPDAKLYEWEWRNGVITVLASSTARDIFCRYRRQLPYPTAASTMDFDGFYFALVAGTAHYAATSRPDVQARAGAIYARRLERLVHIALRDRQVISYRRKAWNDRGTRRPVIFETV